MGENLDLLHRSLEAWNRQDLATYSELYAPDAVIRGLGPGPLGVEETLEVYRAFFAGFPDLRLITDETVEEGERIAVRFTVRGTHEGVFQGIPPTGRPVDVQGISILHFSEGRIVERWNLLDQLGLLQQLGVLPAPGGA
jgi:steroid delta-isomerase-like uncharacterized protein